MSDGKHSLNLITVASEDIKDYRLLRFDGREAISEPFDYRVELVCQTLPDVKQWIGKLLEFSIANSDGEERFFAGRIYETQVLLAAADIIRVVAIARPAYYATRYARGTHFMQDRDAIEIFNAITQNVPGQVADVSASAPPKKPYVVRYDESEMDFLDRLLAQEGIMYFFLYDRGAGTFHHRMVVGSAASDYRDVPGEAARTLVGDSRLTDFTASYHAAAGGHRYQAMDVNQLDKPFAANETLAPAWGSVYSHQHEELIGGALAAGDIKPRGSSHADAVAQSMQGMSGSSDDPLLFAGGKIKTDYAGDPAPAQIVLTSVVHSAYDPAALGQTGAPPTYTNSFTGIDATLVYRPSAPSMRRRAYGPMLGLVKDDKSPDGQIVVDDKSRVPVQIERVMLTDPDKPFELFVWLPVQQAWATATHGAQFLPRIGTRVIVDFLYGDPDLPFVSGTIYTPTAKYPFDPASNATQTGWRSITDKDGDIKQEFHFEDKPGAEEIYMYTGRNYTRLVDNDETGTIKHDRTITVENDHTETVKNDQKMTINHDQTLTVDNNRTVKVTGKEDHTVTQTRTVTVTQKNTLESKQEIEIKVGPSSIKLTMSGIEIKAPQIKITADATLAVSAGASAEYKAPMTQVKGDALLILKGGLVMIN
jgi:type VI secretion system secreted protein VgrG